MIFFFKISKLSSKFILAVSVALQMIYNFPSGGYWKQFFNKIIFSSRLYFPARMQNGRKRRILNRKPSVYLFLIYLLTLQNKLPPKIRKNLWGKFCIFVTMLFNELPPKNIRLCIKIYITIFWINIFLISYKFCSLQKILVNISGYY